MKGQCKGLFVGFNSNNQPLYQCEYPTQPEDYDDNDQLLPVELINNLCNWCGEYDRWDNKWIEEEPQNVY